MRDKEKDAAMMAAKRKNMLQTAYSLFSERGIDSVSMADIARETGYGNTTLHRYFSNKSALVVAVATWKWEEYTWERFAQRTPDILDEHTALEQYEFFLNAFIDLYNNHRDILRFNQFFNIYMRSVNEDGEVLNPYTDMIEALNTRFVRMYKKARVDKTLRTDESEQQMFSTSLHLMLAAVTRYAVGLVYSPEGCASPEEELILLRDMLISRYSNN